MSVGVIIVAAGQGTRVGSGTPKQLLEIGGRTMLQRSVALFDSRPTTAALVIVLPADLVEAGPSLVGRTTHACRFVAGGARRQDSVRLGFEAMPAEVELVLVHDAARPFASPGLIDSVVAAAARSGAAVPALAARDTVKRSQADRRFVAETIPRDEIWLAQTPQGFRRAVLSAAVAAGGTGEATDEAMLAERAGFEVEIVTGDERNIKITTADDLAQARAARGETLRVGTGYDLHRLVEGRPLTLASVTIPYERGPLGHSDGDVVCHSAVDAMFGAAGSGDIGRHFPNNDPRWKDAAGLLLLAHARAIIAAAGWRVENLDVTVILERPKLLPHVETIRERLAVTLGIPITHVSVKGKTNEGVDAVGRGEAIAAHAVALLVARTE